MRTNLIGMLILLVGLASLTGCEKEMPVAMQDDPVANEIVMPKHPQVVNNVPPNRERLSEAEFDQTMDQLKTKSNFSLSYIKECLDYHFSACVEAGADIYDFYLFKDGNLYSYVGSTYGPYDNCYDFTESNLPDGTYTVKAYVSIWDYVNNSGYITFWSAATPSVTISNIYNSWVTAGADKWYVGDFDGDHRDDIFRYLPGTSGADVFLSTGSSFAHSGSWTTAGYGTDGEWYIGDFNGDEKVDIFRFLQGTSGADMYLSTGSGFVHSGSWTTAGYGPTNKWFIGDFNGDDKDDIFRYLPGTSGADVFLSTGSSFTHAGSWTGAGYGTDGRWYIGDFDGDGMDDIFRFIQGTSGADVFLSTGSSFTQVGSWTTAGYGPSHPWHIGDFDGDGRDDIFRYLPGTSGADVFLSDGSSFNHVGSWTTAGNGTQGWYLGKFDDGDRTDIFRYIPCETGADMFLSTGSAFVN